jgi:hypothetical protein
VDRQFSWTRGTHQFKFGVNMRFYREMDFAGNLLGVYVTPQTSLSASLLPPGAAFNLPALATSTSPGISSADYPRLLSATNDLLGIPAQIKQAFLASQSLNRFSGPGATWRHTDRLNQYNAYVQDEWRARKNFTVTYGLRWEYNAPVTEASGETPYVPNVNINGSQGPVTFVKANSWWKRTNWDAFAPRVGISWSPFDQKTVIHAGYGLSFDPIAGYTTGDVAAQVIGLAAPCTATTSGSTTPGCVSVPTNVRLGQGFPNTLTPPTIQPSSLLTPTPQLMGVAPNAVVWDPNLRMPTVHKWNITMRELPGGIMIQAGYVGNRGERLYSSADHNQINAGPVLSSFNIMEANVLVHCKPDGSGAAPPVWWDRRFRWSRAAFSPALS